MKGCMGLVIVMIMLLCLSACGPITGPNGETNMLHKADSLSDGWRSQDGDTTKGGGWRVVPDQSYIVDRTFQIAKTCPQTGQECPGQLSFCSS